MKRVQNPMTWCCLRNTTRQLLGQAEFMSTSTSLPAPDFLIAHSLRLCRRLCYNSGGGAEVVFASPGCSDTGFDSSTHLRRSSKCQSRNPFRAGFAWSRPTRSVLPDTTNDLAVVFKQEDRVSSWGADWQNLSRRVSTWINYCKNDP